MLFIKFIILLVFLVVATVVISMALAFFRLKRMAERFTGKDFSQDKTSRSGFTGGSAGGTDSRGNAVADDHKHKEGNYQTAQRKIIPKNEGEYIDFEEVKE